MASKPKRTRVRMVSIPDAQACRVKARLVTAGQATDATDLRVLLDILGLWPSQDDPTVTGSPSTPNIDPGCGYGRRTPRTP